MGYGISIVGHNGHYIIDGSTPQMYFVGKAIPQGSGYFPHDTTGYSRDQRKTGQVTYTYYPAQPGWRRCFCLSETNDCDKFSLQYTIPDTVGIYTYSIEAPTEPIIFIHSASAEPNRVAAAVRGIRNTGIIGPEGHPVWHIQTAIGYPAGWRDLALQYITLYCFCKYRNVRSSFHGIEIYGEDGAVLFNSEHKPIKINDVATITDITGTDPEFTGWNVTINSMATPAVSYAAMIKPAFMNIDWARPVTRTVGIGSWCNWDQTWGECESCSSAYANLSFSAMPGGLFVTAGGEISASMFVLDCYNLYCGDGGGSNAVTFNAALPASVPIIDGIDYD